MREKTVEEELADTLVQVGSTVLAVQRCTPEQSMSVAREIVEAAYRTARAMMEERGQVELMSAPADRPATDRRRNAGEVSSADARAAAAALVRGRSAQ